MMVEIFAMWVTASRWTRCRGWCGHPLTERRHCAIASRAALFTLPCT